MRPRHRIAPLALVLAAACSDATGPGGPVTDFLLDFCAAEVPVFFAVQNDGATWQRVNPDGQGTFAFDAAEQVGLVFVRQDGDNFTTEFIFASASELEPANGVACAEPVGTKTLHGTASGVGPTNDAWISMASSTDDLAGTQTAFTLGNLPGGPLDLVAHRDILSLDGATPDRIIVRRAINLVNDADITPVLDFDAAEAQAPVAGTLSIGGFDAGEENWVLHDFRTATTTHPFETLTAFASGTQAIHGVPAALTAPGDMHDIDVFAYAPDGNSYRGQRQFHRNPGDRIVTFGDDLNVPVITELLGTSWVRLRAQLSSQGDYGAFVNVYYIQGDASGEREVTVTVTASYLGGTPATWDVAIPDMSGVSGFPVIAMLQPGFITTWYVDGFGGGTPAAYFGYPADGASYRYAGRTSAVALGTGQFARSSLTAGRAAHDPRALRAASPSHLHTHRRGGM